MRVNFPAMVVCITQLSNLSCINIMYKPAKLTIFYLSTYIVIVTNSALRQN